WVAAYWAAITVGRLLAGALDERIGPERLVVVGATAALFGAGLFWWGPELSLGAGGVGLVLVGLGLAPVFPSLVLLTPERVGPERSTAVVGYQLAAASVGAALLPGLVGVLVDGIGLDVVAPTLVAFAVVLCLAIAATWWMPDASTRPEVAAD
ncbi:MAG: MFS transporter, partial [Actinomycetota bacterium]